ncbi:DUF421 domain-containing protein [Botryobacter ruber]|uniref:DUF421 domain-containing protein n=1 Tax=Botryobacter ruber TaxID=2171629 RepID=UPI001F0C0E69|nr:YetF domain-containing protein [Botryobacter ruber]
MADNIPAAVPVSDGMQDSLSIAFGIGDQSLTWWQMSIRAVGVFFAALVIIRIGNPRIFGKHTAFDIVLGVIYGSILSRAITGNSPFWPTIAAALVLVVLHNILAALAYRTNFGFGNFIKGRPLVLIKDGELQKKTLKKHGVTENDLLEALRKSGSGGELTDIKAAYLERSGDISIILKEKE